MLKVLILAGAVGFGLASSAQAGCVSGAVVGGVVGHLVGHHGAAGAAVGCAVGHHKAKEREKADASQGNHDNSH